MKTKTLLIIGSLFGMAFASQANAISFSYSDYRDADLVNKLLTNTVEQVAVDETPVDNSFVSGQFNIVTPEFDYGWDIAGYDKTKEKIVAAEIGFGFYDLSQETPTYLGDFRYYLGEDLLSFAGATGVSGSTAFDFQLVTPYMGNITGDLLLDLSEDGLLNWRVELDDAFQGDVTLYWAALAADAEPIPDTGSTAAMLGIVAFSGLLVGRRFKRVA